MNIKSKFLGGFSFSRSENKGYVYDLIKKRERNDIDIQYLKKIYSGNEVIDEKVSWYEGKLLSLYPFRKEIREDPYEYYFYIVEIESLPIDLLLTENKLLAKRFLNEIKIVDKSYVEIHFDTQKIVEHLLNFRENKDEFIKFECFDIYEKFIINFLYCNVFGMEKNLNSMTLYGKDVLSSVLYDQYKSVLSSQSCGIANKYSSFDENNLVKINNDGYISIGNISDIQFEILNIINLLNNSECII